MKSRLFSNSAQAVHFSLLSEPPSFGFRLADRSFTALLCLLYAVLLAFRFMSRFRALWRLAVRVGFLSLVLIYVATSLVSDYEYGMGLRTGEADHFYNASVLFPLNRDRRSGAGYIAILRQDTANTWRVTEALRHDPNAADLYFGLAQLRLKERDQQGYSAALTQLMKLTPGVEYRIIGPQGG